MVRCSGGVDLFFNLEKTSGTGRTWDIYSQSDAEGNSVMPKISFRPALKGVATTLVMSIVLTSLSSRSRMTSAWHMAGLASSTRHFPSQCHQRSLSAITLLTKERVKAIMEGFPRAAPYPGSRTSRRSSQHVSNPDLTKRDVLQMKTLELRGELASRGVKTKGDRIMLTNRLIKVLDEGDGENGTSKVVPTFDTNTLYVLRVKGQTTQKSGGLGVGLALYDPDTDKELWSGGMYMAGDRTLFEAEYTGVILGMEYIHQTIGIRRLLLQTSSDVIAQQIRGVFKVNKESLRLLLDKEREVEQKFDFFSIAEIPTTENALCIELASKALATRKSFNVELDENGDLNISDPMKDLDRNPTEDGQWRQPDPPSFSAAIDPSRTYLLRFDGGSRGNPGIAGAGMVIYDDSGQEIWCGWRFHHEAATNNLAEYLGLL